MATRILNVDDNAENRYLLESLLRASGFEVISAENGKDALEKAQAQPPDLIVSDILMPVMDGYALCRAWKSDEQLKHIPFVFYTATYTEPKDKKFALRLGAERFLLKPQEPDLLIKIFKEVLEDKNSAKQPLSGPLGKEMEYFRQYNEILFRKLEKKMSDLETANRELRVLEERYRLNFENVTDVIFTIDPDLIITSMSPSAERLLGYKPEDFIGRSAADLGNYLAPDSFEKAVTNISLILKGQIIPGETYEFVARDGTVKYSEISGTPIMRGGRIIGVSCVARDITERKKAEDAKRESEELFEQFMRYFPGSAYIKDSDRRIIYLTENVGEYFGVKPDEWLGKTSEEIWPSETAASAHKDDEAVLRGEVVQTISKRPQKDGRHTWITHRFPIHRQNKPSLIGCISMDITEQKRAEQELWESEKKYRELFDFLPIPVYEMDFESNITSANRAIYETFGGTEEDLKKGFKAWQLLTPEAVERSVNNIQRMSKGEQVGGTEYILKRLDGSEFPAIVISSLIYDHGKPVGLRGSIIDITDRKQAEEQLRQSEERYRSVFENAQEGIFRTTLEGKFLMANQAMARILGYDSPEELMGDMADITKRLYVNAGEREKAIERIERKGFVKDDELQFYRKDGRKVWVSRTMQAVRDERGKLLYLEGLMEDVTDRKNSMDQLRKALGGTVQAIALVVESKDPYTAGHQRRVADISRAIATEMDLSPDQIEGIRMAGIIHDIGKVAVPAEILSSPRKLTNLELSLIKTHAQSGYDILKDIEFPWPIARMVLEHHERINGSGYPNGLTGDDILPESRILAVADVVEAMATHRPYRAALGLSAALEEITQNKGVLYDSEVVDACLRLFRKKGYEIKG